MRNVKRCEQNPLLFPSLLKPTRKDFCVEGVFNCGVAKYKDETILLCRVAESFYNTDEKKVLIPLVESVRGIDRITKIVISKEEHTDYDYSDSRSIWKIHGDGSKSIEYLTSLSHFRLARSRDGVNFHISTEPDIFPTSEESWGIEDARISQIEDVYYITYTSVSSYGASTSLMITKDFISFERKGIIFAAENKDVTIFPKKIGEWYYCFNRPVPKAFGTPDIWMAKSPDLIHWGEQKHILGVTDEIPWINGRIGGGAVPLLTQRGWLVIYHAADIRNRYCLGVMMCEKDNPATIIGNSLIPILEPEEIYETEGFFGGVVFSCGALIDNDTVIIYYGAADDKICRCDISLEYLYSLL